MNCNKRNKTVFLILFALLVTLLFSQAPGGATDLDFDRVYADSAFRDGVLFLHSGRVNDAIVAFQRALSFKPDDILARLWLGRAYFFSGFEEAADEEWQQVTRAGGGSPALQSFMTTLNIRRGFGQEIREDQELFPVAAFSLTLPGAAANIRLGTQVNQNNEPLGNRSMPGMIQRRSDGWMYVSNFTQNSIQVYDANGRLRQTFSGGFGGFAGPMGITLISDNRLAVTSFRSDQVHIINGTNGAILTSFGTKGIGPGEFLGPQHITYDPQGYLFITDYGNQRIQKWTVTGEYVLSFGNERMFHRIAGIQWHEGRLYVLNNTPDLGEVIQFDGFGNEFRRYRSAQLRDSENFFVEENHFYLVTRNRVFRYYPENDSLILIYDAPNQEQRGFIDLQKDASGNFILSDAVEREILVLSRLSGLYSGLHVQINRIIADNFPRVRLEVTVEDRLGTGLLGLDGVNFRLTEGGVPIDSSSVIGRGYHLDVMANEIIVLPNRSMNSEGYRTGVIDFLETSWRELPPTDPVQVLLGGAVPQYLRTSRGTPSDARNLVRSISYDPDWALDLAVRMAANSLIREDALRNIFVLGDGRMNEQSFRQFGLEETKAYMKNHGIRFVFIALGNNPIDPVFSYLAEQTGGVVYRYFEDPVEEVLAGLRNLLPPRYWLEFTSRFDGDFGRRYLPVEVEVNHLTKSGRDESGYFAPLSF